MTFFWRFIFFGEVSRKGSLSFPTVKSAELSANSLGAIADNPDCGGVVFFEIESRAFGMLRHFSLIASIAASVM